MHDVRDRSHRLNRADGIARHGRLRRSAPLRTVAALVASVAAVAFVSTASVAAIAAKQVTDDLGDGVPFLLLGLCDHVEHRGERPIAITWRLHRPMPAETFLAARVVAA